jgi:signal transduction histidine kinase/CheY-like chemotaxis protein
MAGDATHREVISPSMQSIQQSATSQPGLVGLRRLMIAFAGVTAILVASALYISVLLVQEQTVLREVAHYNVTWMVSQAAMETARLTAIAGAYTVGDNGVDRDDVQLRLDILVNQVQLLDKGDAGEFVRGNPELAAVVADFLTTIAAAQPLVDRLDRDDAGKKLVALLLPLNAKIPKIAAAAYVMAGNQVEQDLNKLNRLHWTFSAILMGLIVCSLSLIATLIWNNRLLQHAHREVQDLVADLRRTGEELLQMRLVAEQSDRAKSQFLANMSHEIRTPINGILGSIELLRMTRLTERQLLYADAADRSGQVLHALVNDILDLSKIEAGKLELERRPFRLGETVCGIVELFQEQARAKGLDFSVRVAPEIDVRVIGDANRLSQVLINLISNALKFTASGAISVGATLQAGTDDTVCILFRVIDTGIGIAVDRQSLIFDAFAQADGSTTRRFGGSGLGLTIARQVCARMNGEIGVISHPGRGSTFWFTANFDRAPPVALEPGDPPPPNGETHAPAVPGDSGPQVIRPSHLPPEPTGPRILVAEDNPTNLLVTQGLLEKLNCRVVCVENGQLALEAFQQGLFDLVLMDIQMPEMDGLAATRVIRDHEAAHGMGRTPIVGLSASAFRHNVDEGIAAGMDDYLTKPITVARLAEKLSHWLAREALAQMPASEHPASHGVAG